MDQQPGFSGYVALDLHSADAPQIVWYYSNAPSTASGKLHVDVVGGAIVQDRRWDLLFSDGTGTCSFSREPTSARSRRMG